MGNLTPFPETRPLEAGDLLAGRIPLIDENTPIGSIGSCFARVLKDQLIKRGYNYVQTSKHPAARHGSAAWERVYNVPCLLQEVERMCGLFHPKPWCWVLRDRLVSPYRTKVSWADKRTLIEEEAQHAKDARRAIEESEVFVITLGLNEVWQNDLGNYAAQTPPESYRHLWQPRVPTVGALIEHLRGVVWYLHEINPDIQLIFSLSPVPLRATFRDMTALEADALSKAALRLAAHYICQAFDRAHYFPSYELVKYVLASPYQADNRHVTPEAETAVMDLFLQLYRR